LRESTNIPLSVGPEEGQRLASGEEVVEDLLGGASLERAGFDLVVVEPPEAAAAGVEASPP